MDEEEISTEIAVLFSSEAAAEDAADDYDGVADFMKAHFGQGVEDTESDGEFVTGTATEKIENDDTSRAEEQPNPPAAQQAQPASPQITAAPRQPEVTYTYAEIQPQQPAAAPARPGNSEYWVQDCINYMSGAAGEKTCQCTFDYPAEEQNQPPRQLLSSIPPDFPDLSDPFTAVAMDALVVCAVADIEADLGF